MKRPTAALVFGILNVMFGVLGLLGAFATLALFKVVATSHNPVVRVMQENPSYATVVKVTSIVGICGTLVMIAAGIGLICFKRWGRSLSIAYAIYGIIMSLVTVVANFIYVFGPLLDEAKSKQGPEAAAAVGGVVGGALGGCFSAVYPIILLIFMLRPKFAAAFRASIPPALPQ